MGVPQQKLQVIAKEDMRLQSSNQIATSAKQFDEVAYTFPAGTIFQNFGKAGDPGFDNDDKYAMHGWCYIAAYTNGSPMWHYCNFHAYILDHWRQFPELFEEFA